MSKLAEHGKLETKQFDGLFDVFREGHVLLDVMDGLEHSRCMHALADTNGLGTGLKSRSPIENALKEWPVIL